jgi:hypothetical protein
MNDRFLKNKLNCIESKLCASTGSNLEKLQTQANDLVKTFTYLDAGDPVNRRVASIKYTSASLGMTITETFTYAGSAGDYYITQINLS